VTNFTEVLQHNEFA